MPTHYNITSGEKVTVTSRDSNLVCYRRENPVIIERETSLHKVEILRISEFQKSARVFEATYRKIW